MDISSKDIIIPIIVAILSIVVPLLIGIIQRIDDKYESTHLIQIFMNERSIKYFIALLIITIFLLFYQLVAPPPCNDYDFGPFTKYIDYSAIILATIFCILLTINVFSIFWLIYVYNAPEKLQKHLINKSNISPKIRKAWFDFFIAMLKQNNVDVLRSCYQVLYDWIMSLRVGKQWTVMEYPAELYEGIVSVNEQLCMQQKEAVSIKNGNDIVNIMLDEFQFTLMHQNTYRTIWTCLNQQLFYKRSEWILEYWNAAHSYLLLYLVPLQLNERVNVSYVTSGQVVVDKKMVELRQKERNEFKKFHIALGGLLLFRKEYELLNQLLYFTNSQPPCYVLIPGSLAEIISLYMDLLSFSPDSMYKYEQKYHFLDLHAGVRNNSIIKSWILKYLYILMLRLSTLNRTYVYEDFYALPALPKSLSQKNEWLENVPVILKQIEEDTIPLEEITKILPLNQWHIYRIKNKLKKALKTLADSLTAAIQSQKITQHLSEDEVQQFYQKVSDDIEKEMDWIKNISATTIDNDISYDNFDCVGVTHRLIPAEVFCNEKTIGYANFKESISAETLHSFRNCWLRSFQSQSTKNVYRVFPENLDKVFKDLRLTTEQVIIGFHFNWYNAYPQNLQRVNDYQFKSPDNRLLYSLPGDYTREFINTVIILNKSDLPKLKLLDPPPTVKDKFKLESINERYHLYASVIKLAINENLLNEYVRMGYLKEKLKQAALVCTELYAKVLWKKNIPIVIIKVLDRFVDRGNEDVSKIRPFSEL